MAKIRIERLRDDHDCEDCGWSVAEGANVFFDGELALTLKPFAHCFDGTNYEDHEIFAAILEKLGHSLVYSTDENAYAAAVNALGHSVTVDQPRQ